MKITENYVFFWDGIYSQWHQASMEIDGIKYNCCEQYMMHQKALLFSDYDTAERIMNSRSPRDQKQLGRQVQSFNKGIWDSACVRIVYKGNYAKFTQNEELKQELLATTDRILVEASPYDNIWGIGLGENEPGVEDPINWKGLNLLGWSITMVKKQLS